MLQEELLRLINQKIDQKTKPQGSLGMLEDIARKICLIQETLEPAIKQPHMLIFAADHGIAQEGVSLYPSEVTAQMVLNFVRGGAAINVFCRQHQIELQVVDAGVNVDFDPDLPIHHLKVAKGSYNFSQRAALDEAQLISCLEKGRQLVQSIYKQGSNLIAFGEMGIGNTSSAALLMHYFLALPLEQCVGRGTGLNDEKLAHKLQILEGAKNNLPEARHPNEVLLNFGGLEIAMMAGAFLEAAQHKMIILVDGFIASAAFLYAWKLQPEILHYALFCHQSQEKGHHQLLKSLGQSAILDLNLRLGEGTGAALAYPIIQSAVHFMNEMASFDEAGVSK
ncbi:MAG: nicotinate-nucleotide--dimethylbenzimidazole phosphoribosyltransferase [Bacteroidota bacterium]